MLAIAQFHLTGESCPVSGDYHYMDFFTMFPGFNVPHFGITLMVSARFVIPSIGCSKKCY